MNNVILFFVILSVASCSNMHYAVLPSIKKNPLEYSEGFNSDFFTKLLFLKRDSSSLNFLRDKNIQGRFTTIIYHKKNFSGLYQITGNRVLKGYALIDVPKQQITVFKYPEDKTRLDEIQKFLLERHFSKKIIKSTKRFILEIEYYYEMHKNDSPIW